MLNPDSPITDKQHRQLLNHALEQSGDSGLGLKLGLRRSLATLDQMAYAMMSSATMREAISVGHRYQNYTGRFSGRSLLMSFNEINGRGFFQIDTTPELGELRLLAIEEVLGNIIGQSRWIIGQALPVSELYCDYPAPAHADQYQHVFQCPVHFDAPATQLFFDAAVLDQPLPQASPQSAKLFTQLCATKSNERSQGDWSQRVWQSIASNPASPPSLESLADELHCSPRTLRRKLQSQGWSYRQLIDQVRETLARRYLNDPSLPISTIADRLGYQDSSSFHRAFKKWTGHAPSTYRQQLF